MTYPDIGYAMQCSGKVYKRHMHLVRADYCLFFKYMIRAMKDNILQNYGLNSKMYPSFYENCLFLWALPFSAHPSLECSSCRTSLLISISNSTITLYGRELSLDKRRVTVIGTYLSKLYILHFGVASTIASQSVNQYSLDSLRNVLRWSHVSSSKLATKLDLCPSNVSHENVCMYFHTWKAYWHEPDKQCSYNSLWHCLAGNFYHAFWVL